MSDITIIVSTHKRLPALGVLIGSFLCQTHQDWHMVIIHDGPDDDFLVFSERYQGGGRFRWIQTAERYGNWGHELRSIGLNHVGTPWLMWTNDDNYYVPTFLERMLEAAGEHDLDMAICNMLHDSHGGQENYYHVLDAQLERGKIDIGCFIVRAEMAKQVGFNGRDYAADWQFVSELLETCNPRVGKVSEVLCVHN